MHLARRFKVDLSFGNVSLSFEGPLRFSFPLQKNIRQTRNLTTNELKESLPGILQVSVQTIHFGGLFSQQRPESQMQGVV